MVSPQRWRGLLLALLMLPPLAVAQELPTPTGPLSPPALPDLFPVTDDANVTDERFPTVLCGYVTNVGEGTSATPFHIEVRINGRSQGSVEDRGAYRTGQGTGLHCWSFPLRTGTYNFTLVADPGGEVSESSETNNIANARWFHVPPAPRFDLVVSDIMVSPKVADPDREQYFIATVRNVGEIASPATDLLFFDDNGLETTLPVRALEPWSESGEEQARLIFTRPALRPYGNFTLTAKVDPNGNVSELREDNNLRTVAYTIPRHPLPDIVVEKLEANGTFLERRGIRIDATLANRGDRAAYDIPLRLTDGNRTLANATQASLVAGGRLTLPFYVVLDEGNHTLRLTADPDTRLAEHDESNNFYEFTLHIGASEHEEPVPNLVVQRLDVAPDDPRPGETVLLTALVQNLGDAPANGTTVSFYADGELLGTRPVARLTPDAYGTVAVTWGGALEGDHLLRVQVDPQAQVAELDEQDNNLTRPFRILAPAERPPPEEPVVEPGNDTAPPDNGTTTPPDTTPPPVTPPATTPPRVLLGDLTLSTRPVEGGVKGVAVVSLRNPTLDTVGRMTVTFRVDGELLKEVLVTSLGPAGTGSASTGEVDIPPGRHTLSAEARILNTNVAPVSIQRDFEAAAGEKGLPFPALPLVLLALGALAIVRRRVD